MFKNIYCTIKKRRGIDVLLCKNKITLKHTHTLTHTIVIYFNGCVSIFMCLCVYVLQCFFVGGCLCVLLLLYGAFLFCNVFFSEILIVPYKKKTQRGIYVLLRKKKHTYTHTLTHTILCVSFFNGRVSILFFVCSCAVSCVFRCFFHVFYACVFLCVLSVLLLLLSCFPNW